MSRINGAIALAALLGSAWSASAQELSPSSPFLGSWTSSRSHGCDDSYDGLLTVESNAWKSHESSCEFVDLNESDAVISGQLACWVEGESYSKRLQATLEDRDTMSVRSAIDDFDEGDTTFHRCETTLEASIESTPDFPATSDGYMAAYRQMAAAAVATRPAILTDTGFDPDALSAEIVTSLGIGGVPARPWLTFGEWLAMVDRTGYVERYEPRFGIDDDQIFGLRAKPANSRSFEIIFRLDFDQVFLERLDEQPGHVQDSDLFMVFLAGFNPRDYADGNVEALGLPSAGITRGEAAPEISRLAGRWLSTRSGDSCETATSGIAEIEGDRIELSGQACRITSFDPDVADAAEKAGSLQCSGSSGAYPGRLFVFPDDANMISIAEDIPGDAFSSNYERCG